MPYLPFQLDAEEQGWLEILVKVDKGQLLAWMGSGQQCWVPAILNSGRSGYIGATGRKLHKADLGNTNISSYVLLYAPAKSTGGWILWKFLISLFCIYWIGVIEKNSLYVAVIGRLKIRWRPEASILHSFEFSSPFPINKNRSLCCWFRFISLAGIVVLLKWF